MKEPLAFSLLLVLMCSLATAIHGENLFMTVHTKHFLARHSGGPHKSVLVDGSRRAVESQEGPGAASSFKVAPQNGK